MIWPRAPRPGQGGRAPAAPRPRTLGDDALRHVHPLVRTLADEGQEVPLQRFVVLFDVPSLEFGSVEACWRPPGSDRAAEGRLALAARCIAVTSSSLEPETVARVNSGKTVQRSARPFRGPSPPPPSRQHVYSSMTTASFKARTMPAVSRETLARSL